VVLTDPMFGYLTSERSVNVCGTAHFIVVIREA